MKDADFTLLQERQWHEPASGLMFVDLLVMMVADKQLLTEMNTGGRWWLGEGRSPSQYYIPSVSGWSDNSYTTTRTIWLSALAQCRRVKKCKTTPVLYV
jgi:hypothetical protein